MNILILSGLSLISIGLVFWGITISMDNDGFDFAGGVIVFFGFIIGAYVFVVTFGSEITAEQYTKLATYVEQGKLSKVQIDEAMSDGKITNREYEDLVEPLKKKIKEAEISNAKQQLRSATK